MNEFWVTFDEYNKWVKGWILSNSALFMLKRRQQRSGLCAGTINQTNIEPFKTDKGVKLNHANSCDFMDKNSFA